MRKRKHNRHLPSCMYFRHGAYYLVRRGKWSRLGDDLASALAEYGRLYDKPAGGIDDLIDWIIVESERKQLAASTLEQYRVAAKKIKAAFSEFSPEQVRPWHVGQFMDHYRATPNMANRTRTIMKMAFDHAVYIGACQTNPVSSIGRLKEKKRDRYLSDEEYRLIAINASQVMRAIMNMAYLTAQRISDVIAIRLGDISKDGVIFRQQKTKARLLVNMNPDIQNVIEQAIALHGDATRIYLFGQRNGKARSYRGVRDQFARAAANAGINGATLHDIRAKSLTDAKKQGLNAQQLAGHTTEAQTVRYIRSRETVVVTGPSIGRHINSIGRSDKNS